VKKIRKSRGTAIDTKVQFLKAMVGYMQCGGVFRARSCGGRKNGEKDAASAYTPLKLVTPAVASDWHELRCRQPFHHELMDNWTHSSAIRPKHSTH